MKNAKEIREITNKVLEERNALAMLEQEKEAYDAYVEELKIKDMLDIIKELKKN